MRTLLISFSRPSGSLNHNRNPPIETFVECESATDFKAFEALHNIVLDIGDRLLCSDVRTEAQQMYDELRRSFETFQRNFHKLTLNVKRKKILAFTANDSTRHTQTVKYEP